MTSNQAHFKANKHIYKTWQYERVGCNIQVCQLQCKKIVKKANFGDHVCDIFKSYPIDLKLKAFDAQFNFNGVLFYHILQKLLFGGEIRDLLI